MHNSTAVLPLLLLTSCAQLAQPVSRVNLLSVEQEQQLTVEFAREVESKQRVVSDPVIAGYVSELGQRLAATIRDPQFRYTFRVIVDPSVNAFNIGGGYVYVHTGLLEAADTEGQVASVLSHEMGHQVRRHVAKAISREQLFQTVIGVALGNAAPWVQLAAGLGITTGQLYFGREAEREADHVMVDLMPRAGYDPREALAMFAKLRALEGSNPGRVAQIFSSHPPTDERIENVRADIAAHPLPAELVRDSPRFHQVKQRLG
ncbi:MAG: hypothetical protein QOD06_540 [Candidatus Binatota bacterium]|jgi:predicted Zn-dependent protease|nr:hypothetical protein [Candidatus Binatota bacterium]